MSVKSAWSVLHAELKARPLPSILGNNKGRKTNTHTNTYTKVCKMMIVQSYQYSALLSWFVKPVLMQHKLISQFPVLIHFFSILYPLVALFLKQCFPQRLFMKISLVPFL